MKEKKPIDYGKMTEIRPLKDHPLHCPPHFSAKLIKGESIEVPVFLKPALVSEGVIKER
jgi:hypothetical protein